MREISFLASDIGTSQRKPASGCRKASQRLYWVCQIFCSCWIIFPTSESFAQFLPMEEPH